MLHGVLWTSMRVPAGSYEPYSHGGYTWSAWNTIPSARALQTSCYLLGRHRDAMRQWLKKRLSELLYALTGLKCLCLSINKHTRYHLGVCHPLIHRAVLLSRHHNLITITPSYELVSVNSLFILYPSTHTRGFTCVCDQNAGV